MPVSQAECDRRTDEQFKLIRELREEVSRLKYYMIGLAAIVVAQSGNWTLIKMAFAILKV